MDRSFTEQENGAAGNRLGTARQLRQDGRPAEAEAILIELAEEYSWTADPDAAEDSSNQLAFDIRQELGGLQLDLGRYTDAEATLREARAQVMITIGGDSLAAARASNDLGVVYKYLGRFADARQMYAHAQPIFEEHDPAGDMVASLFHNLAGLAHSEGRYAEGEVVSRDGLAMRIALHGNDHLLVAADTAALGGLLEAQGQFEAAAGCFRRAVEIFELAHGRRHPEVAINLSNLAAVSEAAGQFTEAEKLYNEALELERDLFGESHPETMRTLNNLAYLHRTAGRVDEAREAYRTVVAALAPRVPDDNPVLRAARNQLEKLREAS
ncbi:tetratricopeptide repeat protein [Kribbella sp. NPDC004536]|uniref:tetratricopeptide repeat protein n=1 Tax=Kribbella sp. NPDC004536 TaxID=3364106 RepID=UPI00369A25C2